MKELSYKGFTGSIELSIEDGCFFGQILFIDDHIVYEGQTISEITQAFFQAVDLYLDNCSRNKKELFALKVPNPETHAAMMEADAISSGHKERFATADELFNDLEKNSSK